MRSGKTLSESPAKPPIKPARRAIFLCFGNPNSNSRILRAAKAGRANGFEISAVGLENKSVGPPAAASPVFAVHQVELVGNRSQAITYRLASLGIGLAAWVVRAPKLRRWLARGLPHVAAFNGLSIEHLQSLDSVHPISDHDIVFVGHWQAYAAAAYFRKHYPCHMIYDLAELPAEELAYRWWWRMFARNLVVACESAVLEAANQVVSAIPDAGLYLRPWHKWNKAAIFVPNLVLEQANFKSPAQHKKLLYIGGIRPKRGLEGAIRALAHLPEDIRFDCFGYGNRRYIQNLHRLAARLGLSDRIKILPAVAPDKLVSLARGYGCGLAVLDPFSAQHTEAQPNKAFIYLKAQVPFVVAAGSRLAKQFSAQDFVVAVEPGKPVDLAHAVVRLVSRQHPVPRAAYASFKSSIKAADFSVIFREF